jgi:hypothetical protein
MLSLLTCSSAGNIVTETAPMHRAHVQRFGRRTGKERQSMELRDQQMPSSKAAYSLITKVWLVGEMSHVLKVTLHLCSICAKKISSGALLQREMFLHKYGRHTQRYAGACGYREMLHAGE